MSASEAAPQHLKFSNHSDFRKTLKQRVREHFERAGVEEKGVTAMYVKTITIFAWFLASYGVLVFAPVPLWAKILAAVSLGMAGAGIGFSVMHDAGHGSYSKNPTVNKVVFLALEFLGGSTYLWNIKHNILHHTYANIEGHDDDIDMGLLGRLAPEQPRLPFHRFQHIYIWFLYGMMTLKWHFFDDFATLIRGRIGQKEFSRPRGKDAAIFIGGKVFFFTMAFAIPIFVHSLVPVLLFYLLIGFVQGVVMATIFQLAHCVEESEFPTAPENMRLDHDWATHQVMTTVNFAPRSKLVSWYVGGLNFQIEHHLFPRISHIHYPALSEVVEKTCREFGVPYRVQPTLWRGIRSHFRWLRQMGKPVALAA